MSVHKLDELLAKVSEIAAKDREAARGRNGEVKGKRLGRLMQALGVKTRLPDYMTNAIHTQYRGVLTGKVA